MKQFVLVVFMTLAVGSGYGQAQSGTCGESLTWELENGTLTISGTGEMVDYVFPDNNPPWYSYRENITAVVVEQGVMRIGGNAFMSCSHLVSITLPESVAIIGGAAFFECMSLTSIILPEAVTSIEALVFGRCSSLASVTLPESVTAIGELAFYECRSLKAILLPESVTSIEEWAFEHCSSVESILIPEKTTFIGESVFYGCSSLTEITVAENNPSYCSEAGVLFDKNKATLIQYPAKKIDTSYTIPETVTSIGYAAFYECSILESVVIAEKVTSIDSYTFRNCSSLKSVTIPQSVNAIRSHAFADCSRLIDVTVNWTATPPAINSTVFRNLTLSDITLHVPDGTIAVYDAANIWMEFHIVEQSGVSCHSEKFGVGNALTWELCDGTLTVSGTGEMSPYYGGSGDNSPWYSYKNNIKAVIIEQGVKNIGWGAFDDCGNLASVVIPTSVTSIEEWAFLRCRSLVSVAIPASVTFIGSLAFSGCDSLTEITVAPNNPAYSSEAGVWFDKNKTMLFQYPAKKIGNSYTIPASVTSIGEGAFLTCSSLESILIPEKATTIGNNAFNGCSRLTSIIIPEKVNSIGQRAFEGCRSLASIAIPASVTSIGVYAFNDCENLTEITVALNNPAYSSEAGVLFDKNKATLVRYPEGKAGNSYTIPETVTSIGFYAFYSCSTLVSITITDNVIFLDHGAFQGCTNLESVFISPSSLLTSIGEMAFAGCNLRSITLPKSINSIGIWGFVACNSLIDVTVNWTATPPAIRSDVFFELTLADITLHIPNGTKAIYEAANIWKEFNIVERPPVGIEGIPPATGLKAYVQNGVLRVSGLAAGEVLSVYDASGKRVYQGEAARVPLAVRGMYIIRTETRSVRVVY